MEDRPILVENLRFRRSTQQSRLKPAQGYKGWSQKTRAERNKSRQLSFLPPETPVKLLQRIH